MSIKSGAMGKSRSVSAVLAYLLWKYPQRLGRVTGATTAAGKVTAAPVDRMAAAREAEEFVMAGSMDSFHEY